MMGVRVKTESGESVDGYNIVLGGGVDDTQAVAREVWKSVAYSDIPPLMERLLKAYLSGRETGETFTQFTNRNSVENIRKLAS